MKRSPASRRDVPVSSGAIDRPGQVIVIAHHAITFNKLYGLAPDYELRVGSPGDRSGQIRPGQAGMWSWATRETKSSCSVRAILGRRHLLGSSRIIMTARRGAPPAIRWSATRRMWIRTPLRWQDRKSHLPAGLAARPHCPDHRDTFPGRDADPAATNPPSGLVLNEITDPDLLQGCEWGWAGGQHRGWFVEIVNAGETGTRPGRLVAPRYRRPAPCLPGRHALLRLPVVVLGAGRQPEPSGSVVRPLLRAPWA
jgi:hypothetical protein